MEVFVANEQTVPVDEIRLSLLARHALVSEEVDDSAELSILLVTSDHMKQLNERFAGDAHETDVLSFPMNEDDDGELVLGDVVICPSVAERNIEGLDHDLHRELDLLLVHGTLHLLGYDHQEDEDRSKMDDRQKELLDSFAAAGER